jgi:hypothetical protein
VGLDGVGG